jgi:SWI/SNF-related matrix-associated actin-dependent regulator 1 of chromatin subfamily A
VTSLLTLRPCPPGLPAFLADAVPHTYDEAGKVQFKAMPGIKWVRDTSAPNGRGFWRGPRDTIEIVAATLEAARVAKVRGSTAPVAVSGEMPHRDERLREYQWAGVQWLAWQLAQSGAALLADEMGLGKTPQAIVAAQGCVLVVCPAVVVPHWQAEVARWAAHPAEWAATSWDSLKSLAGSAVPKAAKRAAELAQLRRAAALCDTVVLDELHYASNPQSDRSKALRELFALRDDRPRIIGLTGTPMVTRPRDLWHPLDTLWPGRFGSWWDFTRRYCNGHREPIRRADGSILTDDNGERTSWNADGISNAEELRTRLASCMLRRTKAQVGAELPPRTRTIHEVTLPQSARRDLHAASKALDFGASRSAVASLLGHSETYKIDAAEALARDVMASGGRVLLLTTRRESARELGERLGAPSVTGEDSALERRGLIADAPCAAATLYSVETGINLTGFDTIIFVGLDWVPSRILQGEARIHRIGQDKPCTIFYLVAKGPVDEVIRERVIERLENFAAVTGSDGDERGLARELAPESEEDLIAAIVAAVREAA